jgi:DNA-binding CsgD family transcriptional regulator
MLLGLNICICGCSHHHDTSSQVKIYFAKLDSTLNQGNSFRKNIDAELTNLKGKAAHGITEDARYYYNRLICEKYVNFITDSALVYLEKNFEIARRNERNDWLAESYLSMAKINSIAGIFENSQTALQEASQLLFSEDILLNYYVEQIRYWSQLSIYHNTPLHDNLYLYADSLTACAPDSLSSYHLWGRFWGEKDDVKKESVRQRLIQKVSTLDNGDAWYEHLCFAAGILSSVLNYPEDAVQYHVQGMCVSIFHVSRNLPALTIVADLARSMGELSYALRFMKAHIRIQNDYPDRVRGYMLSQPYALIYDATVQKLEEDAQRQHIFIGCLTGMALLMCIALFTVYRLFRKQSKFRLELESTNRLLDSYINQLSEQQVQLQQTNTSLSESRALLFETNARLNDANYLKEVYIGNLFAICSAYIEKLASLKKNIYRKLKVRQYDDLIKLLQTGDLNNNDEMLELNSHFDSIFLSIFPNFVEEFNALLRPEERIVLEYNKHLSTDIRIYALVRLGVNSSVKIAKILGVSPQTVYNSRMKMRTRATESDEKLSKRVCRLGGIKHDPTDI